jgi:mono/diheme cytochrome c family protein
MKCMTAALTAASFLALLAMVSAASAESDTKKVEAGEMVYGDYCSSCHGDQLRNTSGGVTFDLRRLRPEDRDRFFTVVLDGKRQMPPWRGALELEQIESIWAYIRAKVDRP